MNNDPKIGEIDDQVDSLTGSATGSGITAPLVDAADKAVGIARENVGLVIGGGVAIGLLAAALLPRSKKKKIAKRSRQISALVSALSQALASQAGDAASETRDKVDELSKSVSKTVSAQSQDVRKQAGELASDAADQLNDGGKAIARTVVKLIEKVRG